jgi:hypothetical protein
MASRGAAESLSGASSKSFGSADRNIWKRMPRGTGFPAREDQFMSREMPWPVGHLRWRSQRRFDFITKQEPLYETPSR